MKTAAERAHHFRTIAELGFKCARESRQKALRAATPASQRHYASMAAAFKREAEADADMARHWEAKCKVLADA